MIIVRTPLRLSFLGGGSDLPAFYGEEEGATVATTIDKFINTGLKTTFEPGVKLQYSKIENCARVSDIEHPIIRTALQNYGLGDTGVTLFSTSDVSYGTGLGGSSSFTVGLVHALRVLTGKDAVDRKDLALEASRIEIEQLREPIGRQDHFAAAFGGFTYVRYLPSGDVIAKPVELSRERRDRLQRSVLMFDTGASRSASAVLSSYGARISELRGSIRAMKDLAIDLKNVLETDTSSDWIRSVGRLLDDGWGLKRALSPEISSNSIDEMYAAARRAGALGGKIVGAGGGGFLMVVCEPERQESVRRELKELRVLPVQFTQAGSEIIFTEN